MLYLLMVYVYFSRPDAPAGRTHQDSKWGEDGRHLQPPVERREDFASRYHKNGDDPSPSFEF